MCSVPYLLAGIGGGLVTINDIILLDTAGDLYFNFAFHVEAARLVKEGLVYAERVQIILDP